MSAPKVDVRGILERAGADADAPEGSQAWALAQVDNAVAKLIADHKALYRHYVNTLEAAYDRITSLGGDCDPIDRMEQSDPVLARSRAILARIGSDA